MCHSLRSAASRGTTKWRIGGGRSLNLFQSCKHEATNGLLAIQTVCCLTLVCLRRYAALDARRILLPDDALRDKLAGEAGHVKLWAAVERVHEDLALSESAYKDDMLARQEAFNGTVRALANQVDHLASFTDLEKVRLLDNSCSGRLRCVEVSASALPMKQLAALYM